MSKLISILIASLGRETLNATLDSVEAAEVPNGHAVEIVIADDSRDGAVSRLLSTRPRNLYIVVVQVAAQNVSVARNAAIDAAKGDWLLFVDDDEYVAPNWMVEHLAAARQFHADVVFGPVYPVYPASTSDWFRRANPQFHDMGWTTVGKQVDFGQSGNTLVNADKFRALGLRFDPAFGRTGGEDDDLFRRMAVLGARLVVTDRPKAWEPITPQRATPRYVLSRMVRGGRLYARNTLRGTPITRRAGFTIDAAAKLSASAFAGIALLPIDRAAAFRMCMKLFSNLGKLTAVLGAKPADAWRREGT